MFFNWPSADFQHGQSLDKPIVLLQTPKASPPVQLSLPSGLAASSVRSVPPTTHTDLRRVIGRRMAVEHAMLWRGGRFWWSVLGETNNKSDS